MGHFRQLAGASALAFLLIGMVGRSAYAMQQDLTAKWSGADTAPQVALPSDLMVNGTFLANLDANAVNLGEIPKGLIDDRDALRLKQKYDDLNRDFDMRQKAGIAGMQVRMEQNDRNREFAREVMGELRNFQVRKNVKKVRGAAEQDESLKILRKPIAVVVIAAAVYSNQPFAWRLGADTDFMARTDIAGQSGQFNVRSPVINGTVNVSGKAASELTQNEVARRAANPSLMEERYKISLSRNLGFWDFSSALTYGSSSGTMAASLAKPLFDNVVAVFNSVYPLMPDRVAASKEESLRLMYGMTF